MTAVRRFSIALGVVVTGAFVFRLAYVLVQHRDEPLGGDALYYSLQGHHLAHGRWFIEPYLFRMDHVTLPSAIHPPVFSLYLGVVSRLGADSALAHRIAACLAGAAAVGVIGLVGRRLAGDRAGLIAAVIAALFPYLWINDAVVLSESVLALTTALMLLAAYEFWRRPTQWRAVAFGAALALVALTRAEAALLFGILAVPMVIMAPGLDWRRRLERLGVLALAAVVLIGPWVGFNIVRFEEPAYLSTGSGVTLVDTSCDPVYSGDFVGWWSFTCIPDRLAKDEAVNDRKNREVALRYVRHHESEVPKVVAARIGRMWGVFRPLQTADLDGRGVNADRVGLVASYVLIPLATWGLVLLRRRKEPILPMLALAALVTITAALFYGAIRFRVPADVAIVVCAAVALDGAWSRLRTAAR
ncbi:MAG TPA: glycosyltransferase family 39 protein [Acidimicrobiia bacterium]|nr:glycosyltransferase family 39 protein [Acidimicrobiia bacterium]